MPMDYVQKFTGRAEAYSKYRPSYPRQILDILKEEIGFDRGWMIADVSRLFESFAKEGRVRLLYDTTLFLGQISTSTGSNKT